MNSTAQINSLIDKFIVQNLFLYSSINKEKGWKQLTLDWKTINMWINDKWENGKWTAAAETKNPK